MATYVSSQQLEFARIGLNRLTNEGITKAKPTWNRITSNVVNSKQAYEKFATHGGLGLFGNKKEGQPAPFDTPAGGTIQKVYPIIRALAIKYTKQAKNKDLYGFVKQMAPLLAQSAIMTKNLIMANVLNLGFAGGGQLSPDGLPLFSTSHPLKNNTVQSNLGTLAMSSIALENEIAELNAQYGPRGIPRQTEDGVKIICGPRLQPQVVRAAKSQQLSGGNDNDTNEYAMNNVKDIIRDDFIGWGQTGMNNAYFTVSADPDKNPLFMLDVQGVETATDTNAVRGEWAFVCDFECAAAAFSYLGIRGANP